MVGRRLENILFGSQGLILPFPFQESVLVGRISPDGSSGQDNRQLVGVTEGPEFRWVPSCGVSGKERGSPSLVPQQGGTLTAPFLDLFPLCLSRKCS